MTEDDARPDDVAHRSGAGGLTAATRVAHVVARLRALDDAFAQVVQRDDPVLERTLLSGPGDDPYVDDRPVDEILADLLATTEALALRLERTSTGDWGRTGRVSGTTITALELAREAVRAGIDGLRDTEQILTEARRG